MGGEGGGGKGGGRGASPSIIDGKCYYSDAGYSNINRFNLIETKRLNDLIFYFVKKLK